MSIVKSISRKMFVASYLQLTDGPCSPLSKLTVCAPVKVAAQSKSVCVINSPHFDTAMRHSKWGGGWWWWGTAVRRLQQQQKRAERKSRRDEGGTHWNRAVFRDSAWYPELSPAGEESDWFTVWVWMCVWNMTSQYKFVI